MKNNHSTIKIRVSELPPIIKKMVDNKAVIKAYSKGQITKEELNKRGIRLVNPL